MHITNREDLRVGDIATFEYNGHEFTGRLWTEGGETLFVGDAVVRDASGNSGLYEFVRAVRETPALPKEVGSVILVTECRGGRADKPVVAVKAGGGDWVTYGYRFAGYDWHNPEHIGAWSPAKVVAA